MNYYDAGTRRDIGTEFVGVLPNYDGKEHVWRVVKHEVVGDWYKSLRHYCEMIDKEYE